MPKKYTVYYTVRVELSIPVEATDYDSAVQASQDIICTTPFDWDKYIIDDNWDMVEVEEEENE